MKNSLPPCNVDLDAKASKTGCAASGKNAISSRSSSSCGVIRSPSQCFDRIPCEKSRNDDCIPTMDCSTLTTTSSSSSSMSMDFFKSECKMHQKIDQKMPDLKYETAIAKAILKRYSPIGGDNLFDHLSDIVKRVLDERPPHVIDFFEEFSRNVREQKFHLPERFPMDAVHEETSLYRVAKNVLKTLKLPARNEFDDTGEESEGETQSMRELELKLDLNDSDRLFVTFNNRVLQLQFFWNQCGFNISSEDIFQLALAIERLQAHPSIMQCRFWGQINGIKASYFIVEASITRDQVRERNEQMDQELREKYPLRLPVKPEDRELPSYIGPELTPGRFGWEQWPAEELEKMLPAADPVPLPPEIEVFECPPEKVGKGLNRYSYFVVNEFSDDWIELPVVTPKQIVMSQHIKKFLTGDLEADILSCPFFPGQEKHYLRAMIARITAGTYIAPEGFYRRMSKREKRLYEGGDDEAEEEEEEEEEAEMGEDENELVDNDVMLLKNEKYKPLPLVNLGHMSNWVHVRPHILPQGRVVWIDEDKVRKEREKELELMIKKHMMEEMGIEEEEEEEAEEEEEEVGEEGLLEGLEKGEIGPPILHPIHYDVNAELTIPWAVRFSSIFTNINERVVILRSNNWPGAYTFAFDNICESIYLGWGHKYTCRNMQFKHIDPAADEYPHDISDFVETIDPTVAEEEAYRLWLLKKQVPPDDGREEMEELPETVSSTTSASSGSEDGGDDDD